MINVCTYLIPQFPQRNSRAYLNSSCISATWSNKILSRSHLIFLHSLWKSKAMYLTKQKIFRKWLKINHFFFNNAFISWSSSLNIFHLGTYIHSGFTTIHTHTQRHAQICWPSHAHIYWRKKIHTCIFICFSRGPKIGVNKPAKG